MGSNDSIEQKLFGEHLGVIELRPAAFIACELSQAARHSAMSQADAMLRTLAQVDEVRHDDSDELAGGDPHLRRIEAKVDLLTSLLAGMVRASGECDLEREIRWSAVGVVLTCAEQWPLGTAGVFRVQPSDRLPQPISLPAQVLGDGTSDGKHVLYLHFDNLGGILCEALERHLFRVHRRAVADMRRLSA